MANVRDKDDKANQFSFQYGSVADPSSCMNLLQKWNLELFSFYTRRFQQYWTLPYQFISCKTTDDILGMQKKFFHMWRSVVRQALLLGYLKKTVPEGPAVVMTEKGKKFLNLRSSNSGYWSC